VALRLLGREVLRRAHDRARLRHVRCAGAGDAEVRDLRAVLVVDDDVLRLEVAVDDTAAVREARGPEDLNREVDGALGRERALVVDELLQRSAGDVLHRDVRRVVPLAAVVDRHDVLVLQARRGRRLTAEALDELGVGGEALVQDLQRDLAPELEVLRTVDLRHPARTDVGDDLVAAVDHRVVGDLPHGEDPP